MDQISWAIILLVLAYFASFALMSKKHHPKHKFPPGPKPWPIIGNLNLIGPIPHQSLDSLSRKYGELMFLKFGKFPVAVVSSAEMAKQFLRMNDAVFASRPPLSAGKYTSYNNLDLLWAPYGPYWRWVRKLYQSEALNPAKTDFFVYIRVEEMHNFVSSLYFLSGKPVMIRDQLSKYAYSVICRMIFGERYSGESNRGPMSGGRHDEFRKIIDEWFLLNGVFNIGDFIPWLDWLDLQGYVRRFKDLRKKMDMLYNYVIEDHLATQKDSKMACKDLVDTLLEVINDPNNEFKLTRDSMKGLIQNLIAGFIDTAPTTVEWAIYELMKYPHIMKKAKEELDRVIGRTRWVEEKDFSNLPYIDAIIMESMRLHPVATLLAPHYSLEDCEVAGYDIPKGTMVLINTWSIGRNLKSWDESEKFLPDRFIGQDVDLTGSNFALLPFGSGRRRCPGYRIGLKTAQTTLANILHGFDLRLVDEMKREDICLDEEYGLTTHPKQPLVLIMEPTLPPHLYSNSP